MSSESKFLETARYEIKFNSKSSEFNIFNQWLLNHPLGFKEIFEKRTINNIYFDGYDLEAFHENLTGISSRTKLRLRWYGGDVAAPINPTLELKLRRNILGWKISDKLNIPGVDLSAISWNELSRIFNEQISKDLLIHYFTSPLPVLMNRYDRNYFLSADGKLRVTMDRNLHFYDQRTGRKMNKTRENISPDMIVVELKFNADDYDVATNFAKDIYIPRTKNSKYVVGVQSILGY